MQELGRPGRMEWSPLQPPTADERILVQQYMDAHARADASAVIELLGEEVRFSMPPQESRFEGRAAVSAFFRDLLGDENPGHWRLVPTHANGQLAVANYIRAWGETDYRAAVLDVLKIDHGVLVEITTFGSDVFPRFGMPPALPAAIPPMLGEPPTPPATPVCSGSNAPRIRGQRRRPGCWRAARLRRAPMARQPRRGRSGELEIQLRSGRRLLCRAGTLLPFAGLPIRALHNPRRDCTSLVAVSRRPPPGHTTPLLSRPRWGGVQPPPHPPRVRQPPALRGAR